MPIVDVKAAECECASLELGNVNRCKLQAAVDRCERSPGPLVDEQVLTYLCAYGYACHDDGPARLARVLLGDKAAGYSGRLWLEFRPMCTRSGEGETRMDLAFGHLRRRAPRNGKGETVSGIEFDGGADGSWVAVVEAKLSGDISYHVGRDPFRNQLLRVVETAVTLQNPAGQLLPTAVHVVLLTPECFRQKPRSRFYGCKFMEYCEPAEHASSVNPRPNVDAICRDLDGLELQRVNYDQVIRARLAALRLHWVSYEDVIRCMPPGRVKEFLIDRTNRDGSLVRVHV